MPRILRGIFFTPCIILCSNETGHALSLQRTQVKGELMDTFSYRPERR